METTNIRKRKAGFSAVAKPAKTQESLFAEEKSKAQFYGGFYKKILQKSENYTEAVIAFCVRIETIKKRMQFLESVQISKEKVENKILYPVELVPFYNPMDYFWEDKKFMPIYEIKEKKRERILNILANEKKELVEDVRTLIKRCTL